jgi:signal transduction histidine kinase
MNRTELLRTELLRAVINSEQDVFAVRRQGRHLGAALGLAGQDQIRIAAALSEVSRRLLAALGPVVVDFVLVRELALPGAEPKAEPTLAPPPSLRLQSMAKGVADDDVVAGMALTRPLLDEWAVDRTARDTIVTMARTLPPAAAALGADEITAIRADLLALTPATPIEELAEHNRQLLATLAEVQAQRDELARLNDELTETNKGVVALYSELSEELAATNRGVVALYAELDQRSEQLRAANEAKTRFLANVSHELRAPVTAVVGLTRLLRDPASDPLTAEQSEQLELIDVSAHSLLGLVNELLDLAKAESGRLTPALERTDLKAIFDTLRGTLRAFPRSDATTLVVVDPVGVPELVTDPILLTQVLRNLITNGLKFTPAGEVRLEASWEPTDRTVELIVHDTGIGIPLSEQGRIFEEFHQVRHELQATVTGTGLGLAYARRLVQILGGTITVDSVPGEGATFAVRLPREAGADSEEVAPS